MKVEFFHDVICSFCFPLSYRMRQIVEALPEVEIIHRSFALIATEADFVESFGSRKKAKQEIVSHWAHANRNDDLKRFNVEAMQKATFPFPSSMPGLLACKAAERMAGSLAYWDVFDALQSAFFERAENIEDLEIQKEIIKSLNFDLNIWLSYVNDPETLRLIKADFKVANQYKVNSTPHLIINGKYHLRGAQSYQTIYQSLTAPDGIIPQISGDCSFIDGELDCE